MLDLDELLNVALPESVVDDELRALGLDPDIVARRGIEFITNLREEQRLSESSPGTARKSGSPNDRSVLGGEDSGTIIGESMMMKITVHPNARDEAIRRGYADTNTTVWSPGTPVGGGFLLITENDNIPSIASDDRVIVLTSDNNHMEYGLQWCYAQSVVGLVANSMYSRTGFTEWIEARELQMIANRYKLDLDQPTPLIVLKEAVHQWMYKHVLTSTKPEVGHTIQEVISHAATLLELPLPEFCQRSCVVIENGNASIDIELELHNTRYNKRAYLDT
jgi:hypothetical protein